MENENCITVTHFINPHLFWYKNIEAPGEEFHVITAFEQSLSNLYKNKPSCDNSHRPQKGDKVAVNFIAWNKFIRAEILDKNEFQQEEYIVWALDYGFPLLTKKQYIRNLPASLQADIGYIRVGGIANVYPAEQEYDDLEGNLVMVKKDIWLQRTCNILEKLLADSNSVSFFETYKTENGHTWGDLIIVNHKGVQINAREYLLKTTNAVEEDDIVFKKNCSKFKSIKIAPWLSNNRNTKFRYNTIKHNCVEFSKHLNAALVDENAKRKFEDWQERNERKIIEVVPEAFESSCEISEYNIDDVTFDDSVSVVYEPQINYMGKAGITTKIKQQKYSSEKDLPPSANPKFFEIDEMMAKLDWPKEPQEVLTPPTEFSSIRTPAQNELDGSDIYNYNGPLIDLKSNSSVSKVSSVKIRQKNLLEMRKKVARAEKEKKLNTSSASHKMSNPNETNDSMSSQSKTLNSNPYQFLEQSSTLSTSNNTTIDNVQDNKSELSVKNIRIKHLMALRKKVSSSIISSDCIQTNNNTESTVTVNTNGSKMEKIADDRDKNKFEQLPHMYSVNTPSKNEIKESIKLAKSGYDSLTMVPAGFDITRLQTYKDEKNHWHRKKSTRNDYVPHDNSSSTTELLSSTAFDQSFSSSDNSLTNPFKGFSQNSYKKQEKISASDNKTFSIGKTEPDSQHGRTCSEQLNSDKGIGIKNSGGNNLSSELSA